MYTRRNLTVLNTGICFPSSLGLLKNVIVKDSVIDVEFERMSAWTYKKQTPHSKRLPRHTGDKLYAFTKQTAQNLPARFPRLLDTRNISTKRSKDPNERFKSLLPQRSWRRVVSRMVTFSFNAFHVIEPGKKKDAQKLSERLRMNRLSASGMRFPLKWLQAHVTINVTLLEPYICCHDDSWCVSIVFNPTGGAAKSATLYNTGNSAIKFNRDEKEKNALRATVTSGPCALPIRITCKMSSNPLSKKKEFIIGPEDLSGVDESRLETKHSKNDIRKVVMALSESVSGVGKTSLISEAFGVRGQVSSDGAGKADIDYEHLSEGNDLFALKTVQDFIERRSKEPELKNQLHDIWLCLEVPAMGNRLLEGGTIEFLSQRSKGSIHVPIVVIFTKFDKLVNEFHHDRDALEAW
ncbi:hypothetical protein F5887DRAFT_918292 [Amanita rubescens]|nr:hypothetical protein F5887DRAFT_918292 [Amanita rubescens]